VPFRPAPATLLLELGQGDVPVDAFDPPAFEIIVAAVEHLTYLGDFLEVASQRVFDQVVRITASLLG
jgi:hypothetical protein